MLADDSLYERGRALIADRELCEGEIIFSEKPLISVPFVSSSQSVESSGVTLHSETKENNNNSSVNACAEGGSLFCAVEDCFSHNAAHQYLRGTAFASPLASTRWRIASAQIHTSEAINVGKEKGLEECCGGGGGAIRGKGSAKEDPCGEAKGCCSQTGDQSLDEKLSAGVRCYPALAAQIVGATLHEMESKHTLSIDGVYYRTKMLQYARNVRAEVCL